MPADRRFPTGTSAGRREHSLLFGDFVDDALFHPRWGYYSTGGVRFGIGGHYDTYPLALSPFFGRMIARAALRAWDRAGAPAIHEVCEIGAGNGQLCLDTLLSIEKEARSDRRWKRFADGLRYRIFERSRALVARQRQQLGPLAASVHWCRSDLSRRAPRGIPLAPHGLIVANEVLDCLPHHKVVSRPKAEPGVVAVAAELAGRPLSRDGLAAALVRARRPPVRFREVVRSIAEWPDLAAFVRRHYPERFVHGAMYPPYFAAPRTEPLLRHVFGLYDSAEALWIDYGALRPFHLRAAESRRIFAGPPRSGAGVYDDPGHHDITFMVDFAVTATAARDVGWSVVYCGPQGELARRTGIALDGRAVDAIVQHRALGWLLAVVGVGPERGWQHTGVSWSPIANGHIPMRRYVERAVREFLSPRDVFKLLITRK